MILLLTSFALCLVLATASTNSLSRHVEVMNQSGRNVVVHWVHPTTGKLIQFSEPYLSSGSTMAFNSFVNHSFVFQDAAEKSCLYANDNRCTLSKMIVSDENDQVISIKTGMKLEYLDQHGYHDEHWEPMLIPSRRRQLVLDSCRDLAHEALKEPDQDPNQVWEDYLTCMEEEVGEMIQLRNEEKALQERLRLQLSSKLEPYTCRGNQPTTTPREIKQWTYEGITRDVGILHQRKASQIHVLRNFITPDECEAIRLAAEPTLHRGTVADGSGGSKLSEHRKAWQAGIPMPFHDEHDLIGRVGRRIYAYANHATGYNLTYPGQEDLMSIQYFGRGADDPAPDQYKPHCDGDCAGMRHKSGGRVATMVMYCNVPEVGGGTNFQNAGVYVKPELGAAAFFSYLDRDLRVMETGFTTHSGCPVLEGTKRIAVHWMRVGVDADNPWDSFNTLTISKKELENCD